LLAAMLAAAPAGAGRPRWAPPSGLGPYGVGHEIQTFSDPARADRALESEIWYPAAPGGIGAPTFYDFDFLGLGLLSEVASDGVPPSADNGFPLVVFSHGSGGVSWQSTFLMEALASHGFVVIAPNHAGNTFYDFFGNTDDPFEVVAFNRPLDVSFLIDAMLARSADPLDPLYRKVHPTRIGVAGHSFGGFTSVVVVTGYAALGVAPDPRVLAIAPIAPATSFIPDEELAAIDVPMFLLSGTLDTTTPIEPHTRRPWELASGRPAYRADVVGAGHLHFAAVCDIGGALAAFGVSDEAIEELIDGFLETCRPPALSPEEVKRIASTYLVAFFRRHLYGDGRHDGWLAESWFADHEPLIAYDRLDAGSPE